MSDLEIRSGGAIAVDTEQLRAVAGRLRELGIRVGELADRARWVAADAALATTGFGVDLEARWLATGAERVAEQPAALAAALDGLAAAYELIELRAERSMSHARGEDAAVAALDARIALLSAEYPDAAQAADDALRVWRWEGPVEMARQVAEAPIWLLPGIGLSAAASTAMFWRSLAATGAGRMSHAPEDAPPRPPQRTRGPAPTAEPTPPRAISLGPAAPTTPVAGLADAARRVPGKTESRIRVERYVMPGGATQFAVYVAGTQTWAGGAGDPFDMASNLELYRGERSASLEVLEQTLREAGVGPTDPVHVVGHSQGAMLASALALDPAFDVQTLVTFGSPVEAAAPPDVLSVGIRHLDDPVAALSGAGHPQSVGAPGSFIAERVADPGAGPRDLALAAHGIERYEQTAAMVDASSDPRAVALGQVWESLADAELVDVQEFRGERGTE